MRFKDVELHKHLDNPISSFKIATLKSFKRLDETQDIFN